jgi:hypothetical protein
MIQYYHNPKTDDLIIYDSEEKDIFVIERIKSVRVATGGDIAMGDAGKERELYHDRKNKLEKPKGRKNKLSPEKIAQIRRLRSEMKSGREIAEEVGVSEPAVWKYLKN